MAVLTGHEQIRGAKSIQIAQLFDAVDSLCAGERVLLTGTVYTARDAAHKRLTALLDASQPLPFPLEEAVLYYAGPTPAPKGLPIGSCGPTTSCRMDPYAPRLYANGVRATIGKGERSADVAQTIRQYRGVYFCALGGAGALAAQHITSCDVVAFEELGCESVKRLTFCEFPVVVGIDCHGGNIFNR
ncbi:MAG: fumarate hydratase C-terminal domain-containing protein [Clostridia bacterium]|nr:fumarate hydratase C-terminal domain-containing protein [Clostridia bacterium]